MNVIIHSHIIHSMLIIKSQKQENVTIAIIRPLQINWKLKLNERRVTFLFKNSYIWIFYILLPEQWQILQGCWLDNNTILVPEFPISKPSSLLELHFERVWNIMSIAFHRQYNHRIDIFWSQDSKTDYSFPAGRVVFHKVLQIHTRKRRYICHIVDWTLQV